MWIRVCAGGVIIIYLLEPGVGPVGSCQTTEGCNAVKHDRYRLYECLPSELTRIGDKVERAGLTAKIDCNPFETLRVDVACYRVVFFTHPQATDITS